jgi:hypothetical protein
MGSTTTATATSAATMTATCSIKPFLLWHDNDGGEGLAHASDGDDVQGNLREQQSAHDDFANAHLLTQALGDVQGELLLGVMLEGPASSSMHGGAELALWLHKGQPLQLQMQPLIIALSLSTLRDHAREGLSRSVGATLAGQQCEPHEQRPLDLVLAVGKDLRCQNLTEQRECCKVFLNDFASCIRISKYTRGPCDNITISNAKLLGRTIIFRMF